MHIFPGLVFFLCKHRYEECHRWCSDIRSESDLLVAWNKITRKFQIWLFIVIDFGRSQAHTIKQNMLEVRQPSEFIWKIGWFVFTEYLWIHYSLVCAYIDSMKKIAKRRRSCGWTLTIRSQNCKVDYSAFDETCHNYIATISLLLLTHLCETDRIHVNDRDWVWERSRFDWSDWLTRSRRDQSEPIMGWSLYVW